EVRRAIEIAIVGAAAIVTIANGVVGEVRVALTAVAPTIVRAPEAESALRGRPPSAEAFAVAGAAAATAAGASPISDVRASADYRRAMLQVVVGRVLAAAAARAGGESIPVPASRWTDGRGV